MQPPTDPCSRSSFLIVEPTSGKQIGLTLLSKDGSAITLDYGKSKEILVLKPAEIISWKSVNAGSGTDTSDATQPLYEAGLRPSLLELETMKQPLLVVNNIKPWCSTIQLTNNPDSATYRGMAEHINALRRKLELPPVPDLASQSTAQQWEAYLDSKPGLRQWAAAYRRPRRLLPNARDCHHARCAGKPRYRPRSISLAIRSELRCWKPAS